MSGESWKVANGEVHEVFFANAVALVIVSVKCGVFPSVLEESLQICTLVVPVVISSGRPCHFTCANRSWQSLPNAELALDKNVNDCARHVWAMEGPSL
jgi:hypothetical protein